MKAVFHSAFLLCLLIPAAAIGEVRPEDQLQFADGLYARGYFDLAGREYGVFLKDNAGHAKEDAARYRLAECLRRGGDADGAGAEYRKVYSDFKNSQFRPRAGFKLAEILRNAGNDGEAVGLYAALLAEKPAEDMASASLYLMGGSLVKLGRTNEAASAYERLVAEHPGTEFVPPAYLALGGIYEFVPGREDRAVECYARAAAKPASDRFGAEAWFLLGAFQMRRGKFKEAAEAYEKLSGLYPADERAIQTRLQTAWALHNAGRYADALARAKSALVDDSAGKSADAAEWKYLAANCERQLGRDAEAIADYDRVVKEHPEGRFANMSVYERALVHYKTRRFADIVAALQGFEPDEAVRKDVCWLLAEAAAAEGKDKLAAECYGRIIREYPRDTLAGEAMYRMAYLLRQNKDFKGASELYLRLVEEWPGSGLAPQALFASAVCLSREQKHEEAVRDWNRLIEKHPDSPLVEESLYQKAMSETYLRRDSAAMATLSSLLRGFPGTRFEAEAHYWLGAMLKDAGRNAEAEKELRLALARKPGPELAVEVRLHLGFVLQKLGRIEEAADFFQEVAAAGGGEKLPPALTEWLSEHRLKKEEYEKALQAAVILVEKGKSREWTQIGWGLAGRANLKLGRTNEAAAAFEKALATGATTACAAESALRLGQLANGAGDYVRAEKLLEDAARMASGEEQVAVRGQAYAALAVALAGQKKLEEAARHFMSVAVLFEDPAVVPECLYRAAAIFAALGDEQNRRKALEDLGTKYPGSEWAKKSDTAGKEQETQ